MNEQVRIALTFDAEHPDRPGAPPGTADRILDTLRAEDVRASFFIQGRWAEAYPETARRIANDGHLIGHHSHYHARMPLLSDEGIASDVTAAELVIRAITGADPRPWFRCPFGDGHDDERVIDRLASLGYINIHWDIVLEDWEPRRTGDVIAAEAVGAASTAEDGAVVLLHTWPGATADSLSPMILGMRSAGVRFVTLDQLDASA